ncbi:MAG: polyprenyl synthetase family protein, partial [Kiritimatiellae bacterium]|nr:polyprenyl synthetase family protein [Kiritimatiellia bacterium]
AAGGRAEDARYPAAAIELLHNYTLVHDDLPAMDDDVERRGRPTVWKKYGEADGILAGDALQALACATAAKTPRNTAGVLAALGAAALGGVEGQVEDIAATGDTPYLYDHTTADLFIAAAVTGGLAGGADGASVAALRSFALNLGLAFQYEDDLLDGDSPLPAEETARLARETTAAAVSALSALPGDTTALRELANRLLGRKV